MKEKMPAYIVFQGGGALGMAHLGAWKEVSDKFNIIGTGGTSVGSIVAAFCACGHTAENTIEIFSDLNWSEYVDRQNFLILFIDLLFRKLDAYSDGNAFHKWLKKELSKNFSKNLRSEDMTFEQQFDFSKIYLAIIATEVNHPQEGNRPVIFDKDKEPNTTISFAVRSSISIPILFKPMERRDRNQKLVDGGIVSNFPIKNLHNKAKEANHVLIGVRFKKLPKLESTNLFSLILELISGVTRRGEVVPDDIVNDPNYIDIEMDATKFNFLNFGLSKNEKEELLEKGKTAAKKALAKYEENKKQPAPSQPRSTNIHKSSESHIENLTPQPNTNIYIERPPTEEKCYKAIVEPGALIRIKAPQRMGKTLLSEKLLDYARQQDYKTAKLDLNLADNSILTNLKTFLHWLCIEISEDLELEAKLDEYWQEGIGGINSNCTRYFEKHLLRNIETCLVFTIDNFERLFKYENIFSDFCSLLRSWHETARQNDTRGKIWKNLRLVVVNSTELYPTLNNYHSPFNVGSAIDLPEFNFSQIEKMAQLYGVDIQLGEQGIIKLMKLVGGHPYLVQEALTNLNSQEMSLDKLLTLAPTEQGIFSHHLRQQLRSLQDDYQLKSAYEKVVTANEPVNFNSEITFKLHSLGLVKIIRNDCIPSCDLYRQYFSDRSRLE